MSLHTMSVIEVSLCLRPILEVIEVGIREPRSFFAFHGRIRIAQLKNRHRVEKP
jgi:hypothetical protein